MSVVFYFFSTNYAGWQNITLCLSVADPDYFLRWGPEGEVQAVLLSFLAAKRRLSGNSDRLISQIVRSLSVNFIATLRRKTDSDKFSSKATIACRLHAECVCPEFFYAFLCFLFKLLKFSVNSLR